MTSNAKFKILIVCIAALIAAGCHSGGGTGDSDSSVINAVDPYAGTWTGYWQVPTGGKKKDLTITLVSKGNQQYSGTATLVDGSKTRTGTLTASWQNVTTTLPHISMSIKWSGDFGQSSLDGDIHEQADKYYSTGDVEYFGSSFDTGSYGIDKKK